jgi:hypothetical protein
VSAIAVRSRGRFFGFTICAASRLPNAFDLLALVPYIALNASGPIDCCSVLQAWPGAVPVPGSAASAASGATRATAAITKNMRFMGSLL